MLMKVFLKNITQILNQVTLINSPLDLSRSRASIIAQHNRMENMKLKYNPYTKMIADLKNNDLSSVNIIEPKTSQKDLIDEIEKELHEAMADKEEASSDSL